MSRKRSPLHTKWRRRVEGQIRDTIFRHPHWFRLKTEQEKTRCITSLAKRIVGEIVADACTVSADPKRAHFKCASSGPPRLNPNLSRPAAECDVDVPPPRAESQGET